MGMPWVGKSFFKFSILGLLMLDTIAKCVKILKLDAANSGIWRFANLNAI